MMQQFYRDSTSLTPTFQQFCNIFVVYNLYASHLAVASSLPVQYRYLLGRGVLLDRDKNESNTPLLQKQCFNDNKFHLH